MAENRAASQILPGSRVIALCFISELRQRAAWRHKRSQIFAFYCTAVARTLTQAEPGTDFAAPPGYTHEAVVAAILQSLVDHEEARPFRIDCVANSLQADLLDGLRHEGVEI